MKKFLEELLAKRKAKLADLEKRNDEANDINEIRSIGKDIISLREEIMDIELRLSALPKEDTKQESKIDPVASYRQNPVTNTENTNDENPRGTMEYRTAFMNYVQRGIKSPVLQFEQRADATGTSTNLGVLIPMTVIQSIITGVEKVYGQLYSRVRKTNVQGGVKYPIGSFTASFKRITETTKSDRQNAGGVTGYVEFSYNIGEIRLARTLLQTVLSVPVFEEKFAEIIVKAYVEAMDKEIINGVAANNQCEGILTEAAKSSSRIPAANIIEFTADEMADWTKWQSKLFAKIPLSMRGLRPEFVMTAVTYEANIKTLKDNNNRPVYNETFNPVDGSEIASFKGRPVVFVEDDILKNFDDATDGQYFGMYWVPEEAYAINTNMEFTVMEYFDQETNQYIKKALVINDGKVLDPKYIFLLKKKVATA